jgi:hypothetical protein
LIRGIGWAAETKARHKGVSLDSFAGPVHVEWDTEVALTPLGQLPFFIDFLKAAASPCKHRIWREHRALSPSSFL